MRRWRSEARSQNRVLGSPEGGPTGEVTVEVELVNYGQQYMADRGLLDPAKVTRVTVTGVVDTGATNGVLPREVADRLGVLYDTTEEVLLGQFFLEQTDFFVDSKNKRLIGNPDNPTRRVLKVRRAERRSGAKRPQLREPACPG